MPEITIQDGENKLDKEECGIKCCANIFLNTTFLLLMFIVIYIFIAAGIMTGIERSNEVEKNNRILELRNDNSSYTKLLEQVASLLTSEIAITMEEAMTLLENFTTAANTTTLTETNDWDYAGSLFFIITLCTTIGYGRTAPRTNAGRAVTIIFAIVGIPLTLAMFYKLGRAIKVRTNLVIEVQCSKKCKENKLYRLIAELTALTIVTFIFLIPPAGIIALIESWTYFNSLYYCIITLLTVGFGDFVPGQRSSRSSTNDFWRFCVSCWILIVLSCNVVIIESVLDIPKAYREEKVKQKDKKSKSKGEKKCKNSDSGRPKC